MPTKRLSMRRIHRLMTLRFGAGAGTRVIGEHQEVWGSGAGLRDKR